MEEGGESVREGKINSATVVGEGVGDSEEHRTEGNQD